MQEFRNRHKNHPVHKSLITLWDTISDFSLPKTDDNIIIRDNYARFLRVIRYITYLIENSDPVLWTPSALDQANSIITALNQNLQQFISNNNANILTSAADSALDQLQGTLPAYAGKHLNETDNALTCFFDDAQSALGEIDSHKKEAANVKKEIKATERSFQEKIQSLEKQLKSYEAQFESQKGRIDALISEKQTEFSNDQTLRAEQFLASQKEQQQTADEFNSQQEQKINQLFEKWDDSATQKVTLIQDQLKRAENIVGIIAATSLSGNYQLEANKDKKAAEILRGIAFVCFGFMAYLIHTIVKDISGDEFNWEVALFRLGVSAVLLVPALYSTKESAKHRNAARRNRKIQLELETLEPYLEKLTNVAEREKIIQDKVNDYFGNHQNIEQEEDKQKTSGELTISGDQLLKAATAILNKIK